MVIPWLIGDSECRTQECCAQFGGKFLESVGAVAKALPELPVEPVRGSTPMNVMPISA